MDDLRRFLVSPEHNTVGIYVTLKTHLDHEFRQDEVVKIKQITKELCHGHVKSHLVEMHDGNHKVDFEIGSSARGLMA